MENQEIFVVRTVDDKQMVGVFSAINIDDVIDLIDWSVDPYICEYTTIRRLAVIWTGRTNSIPYSDCDDIDFDHEWTISESMSAEIIKSKWIPIADLFVYFIRSGDRVKIGIAIDPKSRLRTLQTSNPDKLEIMLITPGDLETEKSYHKDFAHLNIRGEWFSYSGELKEMLLRYRTETEGLIASPYVGRQSDPAAGD